MRYLGILQINEVTHFSVGFLLLIGDATAICSSLRTGENVKGATAMKEMTTEF
jgi:hypothetical protein